MSPTSSERYVEFLLAELPRLAASPLKKRWLRKMRRSDVLDAALAAIETGREGVCLEFGVHRGITISRSAKRHARRQFYGFDSFEGFPDDGRSDWQQDFSVAALPEVPANVELVKGWFSETLPPFLDRVSEPIRFLHVDCDLYSSTRDVFLALEQADRLRPGVVICFDELINYAGYLWNELLALYEMLARTGFGIQWIAAHQHVYSLETSLEMHENKNYPNWDQRREAGYLEQAAMVLTNEPSWDAHEDVGDEVRQLARRFDALGTERNRS